MHCLPHPTKEENDNIVKALTICTHFYVDGDNMAFCLGENRARVLEFIQRP